MAPIRLNWRMKRRKQIHSCGLRGITKKEREEHKKKFSENKEIEK